MEREMERTEEPSDSSAPFRADVRLPRPKGVRSSPEDTPPATSRIAFRDLLIFQVKLVLDGLGDLVLAPVSVAAYVWDVIFSDEPGKMFYKVLRVGERWDQWLSLYRPGKDVKELPGGLLEAGLVDADSFLGKVEELLPASMRAQEERGPRKRSPPASSRTAEAPPGPSGPSSSNEGGSGRGRASSDDPRPER